METIVYKPFLKKRGFIFYCRFFVVYLHYNIKMTISEDDNIKEWV